MKIFFYLICIFFYKESSPEEPKIKLKLNSLKKQTVKIHNEILKNNKELEKIKIDIDKNTQKKNNI